ncbi:MAG: hypothetical protein ACK4NA_06265, partial [Alphaproteobacteria bacterium]
MNTISGATRARPHQLPLALLGAAIGCGAPDERCADAPFALRDGGLAEALSAAGLPAAWHAAHVAPT